MNSETIVYIFFLIIYLIIFYLYYNDYYLYNKDTFDNTDNLLKTQYYNDISSIQNISKVSQILNTNNNITISGNLTISGKLNILPAGIISAYTGITSPTGWLLCDGSNVLCTNYPNLFNIIKYNFNSSLSTISGGLYFQLPNYNGAFLRGLGKSKINSNYNSELLNTKQLSQIQEHTHQLIDPGHTHNMTVGHKAIDGRHTKRELYQNNTDNVSFTGQNAGWGSDHNSIIPPTTDNKLNIDITNIKVNSPSYITSKNISNTENYPCNMSINWIIKY